MTSQENYANAHVHIESGSALEAISDELEGLGFDVLDWVPRRDGKARINLGISTAKISLELKLAVNNIPAVTSFNGAEFLRL